MTGERPVLVTQRSAPPDYPVVSHTGALSHVPTGLAVLSSRGVVLEANPALLALLGRPAEEVVGARLDALLPAGEQPEERRFLREGLECWAKVVHGLGEAAAWCSVVDITDLVRREQAAQERALRDPVTGLGNRLFIEDRLARAVQQRTSSGLEVSVVFVDLDGFKAVNDTAGHRAGDQVLAEAGRRIAQSARVDDVVARWAGDEFVVLCERVRSPGDAEGIAARIVAACSAPFAYPGGSLQLAASVGVATTGPGVETGEQLVDLADAAMYVVKRSERTQKGTPPG